ncbi:MAG: rhodanese-like domain-containing protein [Methanomicrobiales archaeon]|nr:rhodanese-like domain-containing protein [Methanomicrobiales archaeon]
MFVQQFFIPGIAHSSYLIGAGSTCAIVDPARDIDRYIDAARSLGLEITHILETHLHADFVSGHRDLAEVSGARIYGPASGRLAFDHVAVSDGTRFAIENIGVEVFDTPGHTPDGVTYVVTDLVRGEEPAAVFTGDALFVGDVGRPDLFPGRARELAGSLYESLHGKILLLPDSCLLFPAHGAGSLCGRAMGAMRFSTIGYERRFNPALNLGREEFIRSLTENMPPAPDHFSRCSEINRQGPPLVRSLPEARPMQPDEIRARGGDGDTIVLSIQNYAAFGGQHIPGSYQIDIAGNFATFAGWVLPPDRDILLVSDNPAEVRDAVVQLRRVGLDRVVGYLEGGTHAWAMAGFPLDHVCQLSPEETHARLREGKTALVDVRSAEEYAEQHIPGAIHIMAPDLRTRYVELDPAQPVILMCRTGHRSSLGCSILKQKGFAEVYNAAGGITGYLAAGYS